ncbi:MAG: hypothetical protein K6E61_06300 [Bacteroidales bacterium]|nr:hypothetical protein [Bacteroidales bacterium]
MPFGKKNNTKLAKEVSGVLFRHPIGSSMPCKSASFIVLTPPKEDVINWISAVRQQFKGKAVIVDVSEDIQRNFSLSYDFADILVLNPNKNGGINAMDISDTVSMLDSLLSLRLCYEKYTPVYLRLSNELTPDELNTLLSYSRLSGIDGLAVQGLEIVKDILELTQGRLPVIGCTENPQEALQILEAGASLVELNSGLLAVKKTVKILEKS